MIKTTSVNCFYVTMWWLTFRRGKKKLDNVLGIHSTIMKNHERFRQDISKIFEVSSQGIQYSKHCVGEDGISGEETTSITPILYIPRNYRFKIASELCQLMSFCTFPSWGHFVCTPGDQSHGSLAMVSGNLE